MQDLEGGDDACKIHKGEEMRCRILRERGGGCMQDPEGRGDACRILAGRKGEERGAGSVKERRADALMQDAERRGAEDACRILKGEEANAGPLIQWRGEKVEDI